MNIAITFNEGTVMCSYRCDSNGITTDRGHGRAIGIGGTLIQLRTPSYILAAAREYTLTEGNNLSCGLHT